jgi:hypothetical protein
MKAASGIDTTGALMKVASRNTTTALSEVRQSNHHQFILETF